MLAAIMLAAIISPAPQFPSSGRANARSDWQEDTEMRPDADPFTIAGTAGTVATGEDVAGTEADCTTANQKLTQRSGAHTQEYDNAAEDGTPGAGVFHADAQPDRAIACLTAESGFSLLWVTDVCKYPGPGQFFERQVSLRHG